MAPTTRKLARFMIGAYVSIIAALVLIVGMALWGAYRDVQIVRETLLQTEISRLRSQAVRTVGQLEAAIAQTRNPYDLALGSRGWFERHIQALVPREGQRVFSAVVDQDGRVSMHSDPRQVGALLDRNWYDRHAPVAGDDVVFTRSDPLTAGFAAYDLFVPINHDGAEIGELHVGFDADWFDAWAEQKRASVLQHRLPLLLCMLTVVALAGTSLWYLGSHSRGLRDAMALARTEHETEVGMLAAGLAHEIRNPLHAIRLNLHALARSQDGTQLSQPELRALIQESNQEIDRIDSLMRELLGFATPEQPRVEDIDVVGEVDATLNFLRQEFLRNDVSVATRFAARSAWVRMDPGRLRQVLLNLVINAQEAVEDSGNVTVEVERRAGKVEISVVDDGPGLPAGESDRLFEPFYSTRSDGSGLGLALTRRFVEEAHGTVRCENANGNGARFVVSLPDRQKRRRK